MKPQFFVEMTDTYGGEAKTLQDQFSRIEVF